MTFEQAFLFWQTAPVLFVIALLILMGVACYLTCAVAYLWHTMVKGTAPYKTICQRISEAL